MEHYYVIAGDEFGYYLVTKKNFNSHSLDKAKEYFEKIKQDNFITSIMYVNPDGEESFNEEYVNE